MAALLYEVWAVDAIAAAVSTNTAATASTKTIVTAPVEERGGLPWLVPFHRLGINSRPSPDVVNGCLLSFVRAAGHSRICHHQFQGGGCFRRPVFLVYGEWQHLYCISYYQDHRFSGKIVLK